MAHMSNRAQRVSAWRRLTDKKASNRSSDPERLPSLRPYRGFVDWDALPMEEALAGSEEARHEVVMGYAPYILHRAIRLGYKDDYRERMGAPLIDYVHEGILVAYHALTLYDPDKGTKFSSYLDKWLRNRFKALKDRLTETTRGACGKDRHTPRLCFFSEAEAVLPPGEELACKELPKRGEASYYCVNCNVRETRWQGETGLESLLCPACARRGQRNGFCEFDGSPLYSKNKTPYCKKCKEPEDDV